MECVIQENYYWINLDVGDDYETAYFHIRVNSDDDLTVFDDFADALKEFKKRIREN